LLGGIGTIALAGTLIPYVARECEKEADITAAQLLYNNGEKDIVQDHIDNLEQLNKKENQDSLSPFTMYNNIWWKSLQEQIEYLRPIVDPSS